LSVKDIFPDRIFSLNRPALKRIIVSAPPFRDGTRGVVWGNSQSRMKPLKEKAFGGKQGALRMGRSCREGRSSAKARRRAPETFG
jgi:hypothetical protein